jgi:hypothetical protein
VLLSELGGVEINSSGFPNYFHPPIHEYTAFPHLRSEKRRHQRLEMNFPGQRVILNGFFISPAQSVILKKRPSGGFDSYGHS